LDNAIITGLIGLACLLIGKYWDRFAKKEEREEQEEQEFSKEQAISDRMFGERMFEKSERMQVAIDKAKDELLAKDLQIKLLEIEIKELKKRRGN
jgi:hypothetical protein